MQSDNDESWIEKLEEEYVGSIDSQPNYEHEYMTERDSSIRRVWETFQESATSVTQLYKGKPYYFTIENILFIPYLIAKLFVKDKFNIK